MIYLCDTNILSELSRKEPHQAVIEWTNTLDFIYLSVITVEEIYFGLNLKPNHRILNWFESFYQSNCQILPVTEEIAAVAGKLRGELAAKGQIRSQADILIAATAFIHNLIVATNNEKDFKDCNIQFFNPFKQAHQWRI